MALKGYDCVNSCGHGFVERHNVCYKKDDIKKKDVFEKQKNDDKVDGIKRNYKRP